MGRRSKEEEPQHRQPRSVPKRTVVDPETGKPYVAIDAGAWIEKVNELESKHSPTISFQFGNLPNHSRKPLDGSSPAHKPGEWNENH